MKRTRKSRICWSEQEHFIKAGSCPCTEAVSYTHLNNWGLTELITRLTSYATRQGEILSLRNWRAFIGEENRRPALERLAALVGQDTIKNQIQEWRDDQQRLSLIHISTRS